MRKTILLLAAVLIAGCASVYAAHPPDLVRAAHELDESARWLADSFDRYGHGYRGHDHREHAADSFARSARHFHRDVERGRSLVHLRREFERLERDYFDLSSQMRRSHDYPGYRHTRHDPLGLLGDRLSDVKRSLYYEQRRHRYGDRHGYGDPFGNRYDRGNGWSFSLRY